MGQCTHMQSVSTATSASPIPSSDILMAASTKLPPQHLTTVDCNIIESIDAVLVPQKCPSPINVSPKQGFQRPTTSLDDRSLGQSSPSVSLSPADTASKVSLSRFQHHASLNVHQQTSSLPGSPGPHTHRLQDQQTCPAASSPFPILQGLLSQSKVSDMHCQPHTAAAQDDLLVDFWALLQQTHQHLQDMLVDLETAKIELDLATGRAEEAEHGTNTSKIQLAAVQHKNNALEAQLKYLQAKEAEASRRATNLIQRNTELTTQLHQAQRASAALELRLERLQVQRITAQQNSNAAAAQAAAGSVPAPAAGVTAQQSAVAAAEAVVTKLKSELSQTKSELGSAQSRAARAELDIAVVRTKMLVAQQNAAASDDRCHKLEREIRTLNQQLGAAAASAEVAAAQKLKLEQKVDLLTAKLDQQDCRLRTSMNAMARASSSLRASFNVQGGVIDLTALHSSASMAADLIRKSADVQGLLKASQQQLQQQRQQRYSSAGGSSSGGGSIVECTDDLSVFDAVHEEVAVSSSSSSNVAEQQQQQQQQVDEFSDKSRQLVLTAPSSSSSSPFAAAQVQETMDVRQQSSCGAQQQEQQQKQLNSQKVAQTTSPAPAASTRSTGGRRLSGSSSSGGGSSSAAVDRQSPIFKQKRPSASGRSSGGGSNRSRSSSGAGNKRAGHVNPCILSPRPLNTADLSSLSAAAAVAVAGSKGLGMSAGLPPRPKRTSSSGLGSSGRSQGGSLRLAAAAPSAATGAVAPPPASAGTGLAPTGSSTPNLMSPLANRQSSVDSCSCGRSSSSDAECQMDIVDDKVHDTEPLGMNSICAAAVAAAASDEAVAELTEATATPLLLPPAAAAAAAAATTTAAAAESANVPSLGCSVTAALPVAATTTAETMVDAAAEHTPAAASPAAAAGTTTQLSTLCIAPSTQAAAPAAAVAVADKPPTNCSAAPGVTHSAEAASTQAAAVSEHTVTRSVAAAIAAWESHTDAALINTTLEPIKQTTLHPGASMEAAGPGMQPEMAGSSLPLITATDYPESSESALLEAPAAAAAAVVSSGDANVVHDRLSMSSSDCNEHDSEMRDLSAGGVTTLVAASSCITELPEVMMITTDSVVGLQSNPVGEVAGCNETCSEHGYKSDSVSCTATTEAAAAVEVATGAGCNNKAFVAAADVGLLAGQSIAAANIDKAHRVADLKEPDAAAQRRQAGKYHKWLLAALLPAGGVVVAAIVVGLRLLQHEACNSKHKKGSMHLKQQQQQQDKGVHLPSQ